MTVMFNSAVLYFRLSLEKYLRSKIRREKREKRNQKMLAAMFSKKTAHA